MIVTYLWLCKVCMRLDQPNTALEWYSKGAQNHPCDTHLLLGIARIFDQLNDIDRGTCYYEKVLDLDASNVEALACLASNNFYDGKPEIAMRLYRRLIQMGVNNAELWNNLGLCCFYASQVSIFHYS
jgi:tetratricopeptide repeat protein 8